MSKNPNKLFKNLGPTRSDNVLRPQVPSLSTRQTDQKTIGPFAPTRAPQTKTQQLPRKVEGNHFRPRNHTCCVGISNPFPLCSCSVTRSSYKMFRFNSSPCRCRSEQTSVSRGNKSSTLFKRKLLQFLVPKKEGTYRPVIDLSRLNKFVENFHFQMENISCLKTLLRREDFMTCIDLKDAYLSVHVHRSSQKYLCFQWRNRCYAFQGLPFGLNTAPRVFTKLIKPIAAYLRKRGIQIIVCLDDFLILGSSIEESKANTQLTLDLLQWLGFTINWEKSVLVPTQSLTFLGLSIDSQTMLLSLPERKVLNIQNRCQSLICNPTPSAREVASLIGKLRDFGSSSSCHMAGSPTLQTITNTAHTIPTGFSRQLRDTHVLKQQCSHRTPVVAPKHSNRKRQYHQSSCPRTVHNLRRLQSRLGCMLPEPHSQWSLVSSGSQRSYKCSRTQSSLSCHQSFSQRPLQHHSVPPHGQHHSRCPRKQQRGNPFPSTSQPNPRTMAVVPSKINSDHRSAPTRQTQQCCRQRVKRVLRLQRMANRPTSDQALSKVQFRSVCITPNSPPSNLCQLETRPRCYLHRCNDPQLVPSKRLRLSTIQSDRTSSEKKYLRTKQTWSSWPQCGRHNFGGQPS